MKKNLGKVQPIWKGEWTVLTKYEKLDIVSSSGSSYIAIEDSIPVGTSPTDKQYWALIAKKGIDGQKGERGDRGPKGDKGEQGETGHTATVRVGNVILSDDFLAVVNSGDDHNAVLNFWIPKGEKGDKGENGTNLSIVKTYPSKDEMEDDFNNHEVRYGEFVLINSPNGFTDKEHLNVYIKNDNGYEYVFNFTSLKGDKGDTGDKGDKGDSATISIGSVTSGDKPFVTNSGTIHNAIFDFILPKGDKGDVGNKGDKGDTPTITVGKVETGDTSKVTNVGDDLNVVLDFVIEKGEKGDKGEDGKNGKDGIKGINGRDGLNIELSKDNDSINWQYKGITDLSINYSNENTVINSSEYSLFNTITLNKLPEQVNKVKIQSVGVFNDNGLNFTVSNEIAGDYSYLSGINPKNNTEYTVNDKKCTINVNLNYTEFNREAIKDFINIPTKRIDFIIINIAYYNNNDKISNQKILYNFIKESFTNEVKELVKLSDITGPKGEQGTQGEKGEKGDSGLVFNWKGNYNQSITYKKNDAVSFKGTDEQSRPYISLQDNNTGNNPSGTEDNTDCWSYFPVSVGPKGENGKDGKDGKDGANGTNGDGVKSIEILEDNGHLIVELGSDNNKDNNLIVRVLDFNSLPEKGNTNYIYITLDGFNSYVWDNVTNSYKQLNLTENIVSGDSNE